MCWASVKALFRRGPPPRTAPHVSDVSSTPPSSESHVSEPASSTPEPPPPAASIPGPLQALHAAICSFEQEARDPQWVSGPNLGPLRPEALRSELCEDAAARLRRLRQAVGAEDSARVDEWLRVDLAPYLDQVAVHLSDATEAARSGKAAAAIVRERLHRLLFVEIDAAARQAGLFRVQPIDLFETEFDAEMHHAAGGRDRSGAPGRVVRLVAIGRLDPSGRRLLTAARVVVGK